MSCYTMQIQIQVFPFFINTTTYLTLNILFRHLLILYFNSERTKPLHVPTIIPFLLGTFSSQNIPAQENLESLKSSAALPWV